MKIRIEPAKTRILGSSTVEDGSLVITPRPLYPSGPVYVAELTAIGAGGAKQVRAIYFSTRTGRFTLCDVPADGCTMFDDSIETINARREEARASGSRCRTRRKDKTVPTNPVVNEGERTVPTDADGGSGG